MGNYLLGLDNGGTMVKAVIFDGNGKEVAGAAAKLRMITPEASMTERDMEELWEANCQVIREALAKAGGGAAEKRQTGNFVFRSALIFCRKKTGMPKGKMIGKCGKWL